MKVAETVQTTRPAGERTSGQAGRWKEDYVENEATEVEGCRDSTDNQARRGENFR